MADAVTEAKLREWMQRVGPRLINLSHGICRDRHQAEEIVQEAFIKLWQRPPEGGEVVYPSWLRRVVVNLSINALQRSRRPAPLPDTATDARGAGSTGPAAGSEQRESVERVEAALARLDEPKRAILLLRASEQLSYEQIAEHLGVPIGTVMSRLNRARTALMEELEREADGDPMVFDIRKYRSA